MARQFKAIVPPLVGGLVVRMIRKDTLRSQWGQGIAPQTTDNVVAHGRADIDALAVVLGDKPYLFGDRPTSFDASLFGTMANVMAFPPDGALSQYARTKSNLVSFVERVTARYWATAPTTAK